MRDATVARSASREVPFAPNAHPETGADQNRSAEQLANAPRITDKTRFAMRALVRIRVADTSAIAATTRASDLAMALVWRCLASGETCVSISRSECHRCHRGKREYNCNREVFSKRSHDDLLSLLSLVSSLNGSHFSAVESHTQRVTHVQTHRSQPSHPVHQKFSERNPLHRL